MRARAGACVDMYFFEEHAVHIDIITQPKIYDSPASKRVRGRFCALVGMCPPPFSYPYREEVICPDKNLLPKRVKVICPTKKNRPSDEKVFRPTLFFFAFRKKWREGLTIPKDAGTYPPTMDTKLPIPPLGFAALPTDPEVAFSPSGACRLWLGRMQQWVTIVPLESTFEIVGRDGRPSGVVPYIPRASTSTGIPVCVAIMTLFGAKRIGSAIIGFCDGNPRNYSLRNLYWKEPVFPKIAKAATDYTRRSEAYLAAYRSVASGKSVADAAEENGLMYRTTLRFVTRACEVHGLTPLVLSRGRKGSVKPSTAASDVQG